MPFEMARRLVNNVWRTVAVDEDSGGGGGLAGFGISKVTFTDAQIKTLPTAPVEIVPAPGAGKAVDFLRMFLSARILDDPRVYTNLAVDAYLGIYRGGAQIALMFDGTYLGGDALSELLTTASAVGIGGNTVIWGPWYDVGLPDQGAQPYGEQRGGEIDNAPLTMDLTNPLLGNLTGGHAANSLIVSTLYVTFDIE